MNNSDKVDEIDQALSELKGNECLVMDWRWFAAAVASRPGKGLIRDRLAQCYRDDGTFGHLVDRGRHIYFFQDDDVIWYRKQNMDDEDFQRKVAVHML